MRNKTVKVDVLARVEGEGGLLVKVKDDKVTDVKFNIFEPPRFFEAFLRGRHYDEVVDIVARICGICPIAYQMSAAHALEDAFKISVSGQLRELRRLLYCGEWIESHVLHIFFLHAPDFLGYEDAIRMAKDHGPVVQQALKLKKIGNELVSVLGGREIHPISARVGGFYKAPTTGELAMVADRLKWARDAALDAVRFTATLPFPDFEQDYEFVSLRHGSEYPFNEGRLVSNKGLNINVQEYDLHFEEQHVAHSNALQSVRVGHGPYLVGPLARYNLNYDLLSPLAREAAQEAGLGPVCRNPFKSIIVRAVETLYACDEALRIIAQYERPAGRPVVEFKPIPGVGYACTEAPRGFLYHRYRVDSQGHVLDAKIVPPTSQNQRMMEADLKAFVTPRIEMPHDQLTWQCEQVIRNYDPCISCATHFLKLRMDRD
jgi:coenzyme F420-reducing hydrogenase alpha subunit